MVKKLSRHGFTLVELLIGVFLFSVGILAVLTMHTQAAQATAAAMMRTQALSLAQNQMEVLLRQSYGSLPSGTGTVPTPPLPSRSDGPSERRATALRRSK